jgi:hypothetical protein
MTAADVRRFDYNNVAGVTGETPPVDVVGNVKFSRSISKLVAVDLEKVQ